MITELSATDDQNAVFARGRHLPPLDREKSLGYVYAQVTCRARNVFDDRARAVAFLLAIGQAVRGGCNKAYG